MQADKIRVIDDQKLLMDSHRRQTIVWRTPAEGRALVVSRSSRPLGRLDGDFQFLYGLCRWTIFIRLANVAADPAE